MRKTGIALLLAFIVCAGVFAQESDEYKQIGKAIHTLEKAGLVVAHPAERFGSRITLVNPETHEEVIAKVLGRPMPPLEEGVILNLSDDIWDVLDMDDDTMIAVKNLKLSARPSGPDSEADQPLSSSSDPASPPLVFVLVYPSTPRETPPNKEPPADSPHSGIEVIPGYPNPSSGKIYRLQVGSFAVTASSEKMTNDMLNAGFDVVRELYNSPRPLYRVMITGIPAAQVHSTIQRLERLGIKQVWVRE